VLEQLEDVAVRIAEEDLHVSVAPWHRATRERHAVLGEASARGVEIPDFEREVMRHAPLSARTRIRLSGTTCGVRVGEEVDLGSPEAEPRSVEGEVRRALHLLESECLGVEPLRSLEIGDDETNVLDAHRHDAYRNLAEPTKEARCR
jgi:hypothetical protein